MCQNTTMRVNGAWIKIYCVLCSKTYNTLHSCHNFPSVNLCLERWFLPQWQNIYKSRHVNIVLRGCYLCHVIRRHRKQWRSSHATMKKRPRRTPSTIAWGRAHCWIFIQWDSGEMMAVVTAAHIMCTYVRKDVQCWILCAIECTSRLLSTPNLLLIF